MLFVQCYLHNDKNNDNNDNNDNDNDKKGNSQNGLVVRNIKAKERKHTQTQGF